MMQNRFTAVLFDLDNTLEEFSEAKHRAKDIIGAYVDKRFHVKGFGKCLLEVNKRFSDAALKKKNYHLYDRRLWFKECFKRFKIKLNSGEFNYIVNWYWRLLLKSVKLLPHVKETLKALRKKGMKVVLITDADDTEKRKIDRIKRLGIYEMFDMIITGNEIKSTKPDRRFFIPVFRRFNIKPSDCIAVGDKPEYDLLLPKKMGMSTVWMKYGEHNAGKKAPRYVDHTIKDIKQMLGLIRYG